MAHSPSKENPQWQPLQAHAEGVSTRLVHHLRYLTQNVPELLSYAKLTGYLHDLGKYREEFQKHRLGWDPRAAKEITLIPKAVSHSDAGAKYMQALLEMDREVASELPFVISNHHGRLRDVDALLGRLNDTNLQKVEDLVELAEVELPELTALLEADLPDLPLARSERAFVIRFMLGALVDADRLDTEAHGSPSRAELRKLHAAEQNEMALLFERGPSPTTPSASTATTCRAAYSFTC